MNDLSCFRVFGGVGFNTASIFESTTGVTNWSVVHLSSLNMCPSLISF